tara:strand:- start:431 stop:649 length:219 start_codon:yes stop_codon:yes gene_type:complete
MTTQQTLKFNIRQDGTVTEEVIGAVGEECEQLTRIIEERLGEVTQKEYKPEYYQQLNDETYVEEFTHDSEGC